MKKVKLIIELDEDLYKEKIRGTTSSRQDRKILECVKNGTPLEEEGYITTIERRKKNMPCYPFD